jgi:hypothetical protein
MKNRFSIVLTAFFISQSVQASESVYTELGEKSCQTIHVDEQSASSEQTCAGIAGYKLTVLDSDARQSVDVISPDGQKHPLNLWQVVSNSFSELGDKAEWRGVQASEKFVPQAVIIRFNAFEFPELPKKSVSYLVVTKITPQQICITDKIPPGTQQNQQARIAADSAAGKPCL